MTSKQKLPSSDLKRRAKSRAMSAGPGKHKARGKGPSIPLEGIAEFYRPLKKPITLRIDADVLAWFKKDGSRYQTRINRALRKIMEREMKDAGW